MSEEQRPWHRLFALAWLDFFRGLPVTIDPEKDLALKKQLLDLLLCFDKLPGPLPCRMPDGFDCGTTYNLLTFKSFRETLSAWALRELVGHEVNLRKQLSPSMREEDLLPDGQFQMFAVCVRFPHNLAQDDVVRQPIQPGVYETRVLGRRIRILAINQLPLEEHNAMLLVFSDQPKRRVYAGEHYQVRSSETNTLLLQLVQQYRKEGLTVPDLLEELQRQTIEQLLKDLPVEKLLERVPLAKRLEGVPAQEVLAAIPPEKRLEGLSAHELLAALSPEARVALILQVKAEEASSSGG